MLLIQGKTEVIAQKVEIKEKGAKYIGTKLQDKEIDTSLQNLIDKEIIDLSLVSLFVSFKLLFSSTFYLLEISI